jgi:uncharacterized membrane protein
MIDMGTFGGSLTVAVRINNKGQAVGWSETGSGAAHAFLWTR